MVGLTSFEKGIEMGTEKGKRDLLIMQLEAKFGPLSEAVRQRVAEWPTERPDELAGALLRAVSFNDLGLED